jgi:hypothetical protein
MSSYEETRLALKDHPIWEQQEKEAQERHNDRLVFKDDTVYTASTLADYMNCPWGYNLKRRGIKRKHKNVVTMRGTCFHNAADMLHRGLLPWDKWRDAWEAKRDEVETDPFNAELPFADTKSNEKIDQTWDEGAIMFGNYVEQERYAPVKLSEARFFMHVIHPETKTVYRMSGEVDQILGATTISLDDWIRDLKTGAATPDPMQLRRAFQFTTYGYALKHATFITPDDNTVRFDKHPGQLVYYQANKLLPYKRKTKQPDGSYKEKGDLRGDPNIIVPRTQDDYDYFPIEVCSIIRGIRMKMFPHNPVGISCRMCPVSHMCTNDKNVMQELDSMELLEEWEGTDND